MVNVLVVSVLAVLGMVFGALWYSPKVFGKRWAQLAHLRTRDFQQSSKPIHYVLAFIAVYVTILVLAFVVAFSGVHTFGSGLLVGLMVWLGFIVTSMLNPVLWEHMSWELFFIKVAHFGVLLMLCGGVLAIW